jgi:hypothetical protein
VAIKDKEKVDFINKFIAILIKCEIKVKVGEVSLMLAGK